MSKVEKAKFKFEGYLINETHIKIINPKIKKEIKFGFSPSGVLNKGTKTFILNMGINISDSEDSFNMNVNIQGRFKYEAKVINDLKPFLINNAPAILFPYIRAYVASLSALSGIPCLTLPTLNMQGISKDLEANMSEE